MSMMTFFRRAFGSSSVTDEEEGGRPIPDASAQAVSDQTVTPSAPVGQAVPPPYMSAVEPVAVVVTESEADVTADPTLADDIFDAVIELFNRNQPEFVRQCLNVEAQRSYIVNSLSCSLRRRMAALSSGNLVWEKEREELELKIAALEGEDGEISRLRKENDSLRLEAERQQRMFNDHARELERHISRLTQENERYLSHNHPLDTYDELNEAQTRMGELEEEADRARTRAAEAEARSAALEARITELESAAAVSEAAAANIGGTDSETSGGEAASVAAMETRVVELEELRDRLENEKAELTAECARLREEMERQTTLREQLEVKTSMSDAMINELRNQAASARRELEQMQEEQETAIGQIQQQLDGFEELKARKDAKISELQEVNADLRKTIENNLYNQANSEMKLRLEIKGLKAELAKLSAPPEPSPVIVPLPEDSMSAPARQPRRRGRPKKARIDSDLDNTEWFAGGDSKHRDPDFGYHEPPRRPMNDDDAQLTLF